MQPRFSRGFSVANFCLLAAPLFFSSPSAEMESEHTYVRSLATCLPAYCTCLRRSIFFSVQLPLSLNWNDVLRCGSRRRDDTRVTRIADIRRRRRGRRYPRGILEIIGCSSSDHRRGGGYWEETAERRRELFRLSGNVVFHSAHCRSPGSPGRQLT